MKMSTAGIKDIWRRVRTYKLNHGPNQRDAPPSLNRTDSAIGSEPWDDINQGRPQSRPVFPAIIHDATVDDLGLGSQALPSSLIYKPLVEADNEIRILSITPGTSDEELRCGLQHYACVQKFPTYIALSYCWGDLTDATQITVNGSAVSVTRNLAVALRALRKAGSYRIWCDALCINQLDEDEKGTQILRMDAIYRNATSTIAWLGPDEEHQAEIAFKRLRLLASQKPRADFEAFIARLFSGYKKWRDDPGWSSIKTFMEFAYWRRTWIIQELVFSPSVRFWWGQSSIDLDALDAAMSTLRERKPKDYFESGYKDIIYLLAIADKTRKKGEKAKGMELERVLTFSCRSLASEPRDKIFGVLGLSNNGSQLIPRLDYRQPLDEIFRQMTISRLRHPDSHTPSKVNHQNPIRSRPLDLICIDNPTIPKRAELPSWVLDWKGLWRGPAGNFWSSSVERGLQSGYLACGTSPAFTQISDDGMTLTVRGFVFDRVSSLSGVYLVEEVKPHRYFLSPGVSEPQSERDVELSIHNNVYGNESKLYEAIWRGLIGDRYWKGKGRLLTEQPPSSYSNYFRQIWTDDSHIPKGERMRLTSDCITAVKSFEIYGKSLKEWSSFTPAEVSMGNINVQDLGMSTLAVNSDADPLEFVYACKFRDMFHRRVLTTRKGWVGLAHAQSQPDDFICLLQGCTVPMILRACDHGFRVIGDAYVHGIMNGEFWNQQSESSMRQFDLR